MKRGFVLLLCALAMGAAQRAAAQTVTLSLDIFYADPDNPGTSGGAWQLLATASNRGLAGLTTAITGNSSTAAADLVFMANTGLPADTFKTVYDAKPWFTDTDNNAATLNMLFGQVPLAAGQTQLLSYDQGATTGSGGVDELGNVVAPPQNMSNAILLALGRFNAGSTPAFVTGATAANVFVTPGDATNPPPIGPPAGIQQATVTTQVRNNTNTLSGDVNLDKIVRNADVLLLLPHLTSPASDPKLWQQGDINGDHIVRNADVLLLLPKLTAPAHPSTASGGAVPEPGSIALATFAVLGVASLARRRQNG